MSKESAQRIIESIRLLFTHKKGDFGADSQCKGAEGSCAAPILKVGRPYFGYKISVPLFSAGVNRCSQYK